MGSRDWLTEERFPEQIHQQEKEPENFGIFATADTKEERKSWEMHKWGGTKRKKILGAQKTQRKQKSKNWGMLLNEQTWETGLRPRQDKEGKGIHESSDEFHVWKIKSWKWWKEHTKERNEKREWTCEKRCENQKAHEIPDVSEQKESHKNMERVQEGDTTRG